MCIQTHNQWYCSTAHPAYRFFVKNGADPSHCLWISLELTNTVWLSWAPFRTKFGEKERSKWSEFHLLDIRMKQCKRAPNASSIICMVRKQSDWTFFFFFLINWYLYSIRTMRCVISNQSKQRSEMEKKI